MQIAMPNAIANRRVAIVSNELELNLRGASARSVVAPAPRVTRPLLNLTNEVNPRDVVELRVSFARNLSELNQRLRKDVSALAAFVNSLKGSVYGGSSIIADTSDLQPTLYRTTLLSHKLARGFMDISSQQIVLGVTGERFGIELHNFYKNIGPVLVALTASSRYEYSPGSVGFRDSGLESRRMGQYEASTARYPRSTIEVPTLKSMDHYYESYLRPISEEVKRNLRSGAMDVNYKTLYTSRLANFDMLEPHQVFWHVRPRPDFAMPATPFVLEIRSPDIPTTITGMQMLNAFVIGLAYHAERHGTDSLPQLSSSTFRDMILASEKALDTRIGDTDLRTLAAALWGHAESALRARGYNKDAVGSYAAELWGLLERGTYSQRIATIVGSDGISNATQMVDTLAANLRT